MKDGFQKGLKTAADMGKADEGMREKEREIFATRPGKGNACTEDYRLTALGKKKRLSHERSTERISKGDFRKSGSIKTDSPQMECYSR